MPQGPLRVPRGYFRLNLAFAQTAARATGVGLSEALRRWTNVYLCLCRDQTFAADDPVWRDYVAGLGAAADPVDHTYRLYLERRSIDRPAPASEPGTTAGCFRCVPWDGGRLRLHFENRDDSPQGPLSRQRAHLRRAELAQLVCRMRDRFPEARTVVGGSWLYNIEAYRRLFPPAYLATAFPSGEAELRYLSLWGQFLDHEGCIKDELAGPFLQRLASPGLAALDDVRACLPFQVLRLEAPLACFCAHFGL